MDQQYNVLLLMTDQQRADTLGCYGNEVIETVNLDWIASEGTVFTQAYTPSPSCVPARASLLTGMDPWHTGILGMGKGQGPMGVGFEHTLPDEFAKAGYHTQGIGKMHFFPQRSLNGFHHTLIDESGREEDPGFISDYKSWFDQHKDGDYGITDHGMGWNSWMARPYHAPEHLHPTNWTVNESIRFLKQRDPNKPFFLKTSFARPHSPYDAPAYYFDLYMNKDLPKPYIGDWASVHDVPEDAAAPDTWRGRRSNEEIHRARAGYYGLINHIDHQIGRLLTVMSKQGVLKNTIIVFCSDHGDMMGDHHLWRKTYAYEGSARIPLIIKLPDALRSKSHASHVHEPVVLQDIMPTLLDLAGLEIPGTVNGLSLKNTIISKQKLPREYIHGEHSNCYSEEQEMQFITNGKYKYIWFPRLGTEQLFDLRNIFSETCDLSQENEYQPLLIQFRKELVAILEQRNAGLTNGDQLVTQAGNPPIVSPEYKKRQDRVNFDWMDYKKKS
jgi:arylsulfatase